MDSSPPTKKQKMAIEMNNNALFRLHPQVNMRDYMAAWRGAAEHKLNGPPHWGPSMVMVDFFHQYIGVEELTHFDQVVRAGGATDYVTCAYLRYVALNNRHWPENSDATAFAFLITGYELVNDRVVSVNVKDHVDATLMTLFNGIE